MSVFEIEYESGLTRVLKTDTTVSGTPWQIATAPDLNYETIQFQQLVVSERGLLQLTSPKFSGVRDYDPIVDNPPEWSFFTPRLYPASEILQKSIDYEYNLFLDRLDTISLPNAFGLPFDPKYQSHEVIEDLTNFNPSIILLRMSPLEDTSPRKYIDQILKYRELIPPDIALYIPGAGGIGFNTLLSAIGVDIFDDMPAYRFAARQRGFVDGFVEYLPHVPVATLIEMNKDHLQDELKAIKHHIERNTLWTRLHREMHTHPHVASTVTLLANDFKNKLPYKRFPKYSLNYLQFTGEEGLYHPDVLAFQQRLFDNYKISDQKKILLLVPCSAKKPYVESRSHRKFERVIQKSLKKYRHLVEVWSLTSPLAVVPRGLETVYPAANYDIPVTGNWTEQESEITGNILGNLLERLPKGISIVAHISSGYQDMLKIASSYRSIDHFTTNDKPTSRQSLTKLDQTLKVLGETFEDDCKLKSKFYLSSSVETINTLARYAHGISFNLIRDLSAVRILGRPPRPVQVQLYKKHYLSWDKLRGKLNLSPQAAVDVATESNKWILTGAEKLRGSNFYAVGIENASEKICPGDEVLFFNSNKSILLGIGTATVSGWTMNRLSRGKVAEIRKKMEVTI